MMDFLEIIASCDLDFGSTDPNSLVVRASASGAVGRAVAPYQRR